MTAKPWRVPAAGAGRRRRAGERADRRGAGERRGDGRSGVAPARRWLASAASAGEGDDHERGGDRAAEGDVEAEREHGHDHEAAADAEEAGERADAEPGDEDHGRVAPAGIAVLVGARRSRSAARWRRRRSA